ncbi:MAG: helix-turn-helix domain-containing protein [Terrimicrobiaceae bacterium]
MVGRTSKEIRGGGRYFDPHTGIGVQMDGMELPSLRIHECGATVLGMSWNHHGVRSPFWRAYFNPDAGASVRVEGKWLALGPSRLVIVPEDTLFDCKCQKSARHFWMHFSYPLAGDPPPVWSGKLKASERALWHSLYELTNKKSSSHRLRHACAGALMQEFGKMEESLPPARSEKLRRIHAWMENGICTPPSLEEMATHAGMSRRSFLRWFSNETGETPVAYLRRIRIREACRLLRFGIRSVDEIAEATGFADRYHFTRAFTAVTGMGPAAFRRANSPH